MGVSKAYIYLHVCVCVYVCLKNQLVLNVHMSNNHSPKTIHINTVALTKPDNSIVS